MPKLQVEAIFGLVLALVVFGVVLYAIADTKFPGVGGNAATPNLAPIQTVSRDGNAPRLDAVSGQDLICECYDDGFDLAARDKVLSAAYRTGFEQCRARGGVDGGDAWTAGWNARQSAKPYEASCRSYKRRK